MKGLVSCSQQRNAKSKLGIMMVVKKNGESAPEDAVRTLFFSNAREHWSPPCPSHVLVCILHVSSTGLWSVYSGQYGMSVEEDRDGCSVRTRCTLPKCLLATKK